MNYKLIFLFLFIILSPKVHFGQNKDSSNIYLDQILNVLPDDRYTSKLSASPWDVAPHVTPEDFVWSDWLKRTGELPPDFNKLPSIQFLPNPLILDEGGKNIPVETTKQWQKKREKIMQQAQH